MTVLETAFKHDVENILHYYNCYYLSIYPVTQTIR